MYEHCELRKKKRQANKFLWLLFLKPHHGQHRPEKTYVECEKRVCSFCGRVRNWQEKVRPMVCQSKVKRGSASYAQPASQPGWRFRTVGNPNGWAHEVEYWVLTALCTVNAAIPPASGMANHQPDKG